MVLGPVQVLGPSGNRIRLASAAQRRLVSLLVLRANTIVRAEALEDSLDLSPGALRTSVCRLRRLLGADVLVTVAPGYELRATAVDALRFESLLAEARRSAGARSVQRLEEAVELWRGDAYEEFAHEPWAEAEVERLAELRAGAMEELVSWDLRLGEWSSAIARADRLVALHPFRDRPRGLLMRALAASGRQADALRTYQTYRSLLIDEVGAVPGPELAALDRHIASRGEPYLLAGRSVMVGPR